MLNTKEKEEKIQKENRRKLAELAKQPGNNQCCDCTALRPTWASTNLGIFICLRCAGIHRSLGSHVSFVRSITMDDWKPNQIENMFSIGNTKSTMYYECNKPEHVRKPSELDPIENVREYITDKYVRRKYADRNNPSPSEQLEQMRLAKMKEQKKIHSSKMKSKSTSATKKVPMRSVNSADPFSTDSKSEDEDDENKNDFSKSKKTSSVRSSLSFNFDEGIESKNVLPHSVEVGEEVAVEEEELISDSDSSSDQFSSSKKKSGKKVAAVDITTTATTTSTTTTTTTKKKKDTRKKTKGTTKKSKTNGLTKKSTTDIDTNQSSPYDFLLQDEPLSASSNKKEATSVKELTDFLGDITIEPPKPLSIEEFEEQLKLNLQLELFSAPKPVSSPVQPVVANTTTATPAANQATVSVDVDRPRSGSLVSLGDKVHEDRVVVISEVNDQVSSDDGQDKYFSSDSEDEMFFSSKKKKQQQLQEMKKNIAAVTETEEKPKKKKVVKKKKKNENSTAEDTGKKKKKKAAV
jgi:hypothetical protein